MSFIKKDYVKDFIVRLMVSRPEALNALNIDVIQELDDNLKDCINDDKVGVIAEIPGLDKKDLSIEVEEGVLTIAGNKHGLFDDTGAKVIRRELKQSSFKRQFELGELLDGDKVKASFKDGLLSIDIPKVEPVKPKKKSVKIS